MARVSVSSRPPDVVRGARGLCAVEVPCIAVRRRPPHVFYQICARSFLFFFGIARPFPIRHTLRRRPSRLSEDLLPKPRRS